MSGLSDIKSVDWWLDQWGEWSRTQTGVRLKYPSIGPVERLRAKSEDSVYITHEEGVLVDAAVSSLKLSAPEEHDILEQRYPGRREYHQIARDKHRRYSDVLAIGRRARASVGDILFPNS